mgnify:CR=1 FL=1
MEKNSTQELKQVLQVVTSTIKNCEKTQPKFEEGTSQHSLLKNRIKALYISKALLEGEDITEVYSKEDLANALPKITSIISKSENGIKKFKDGHSTYTRFKKIIDAMNTCKALVLEAIDKY